MSLSITPSPCCHLCHSFGFMNILYSFRKFINSSDKIVNKLTILRSNPSYLKCVRPTPPHLKNRCFQCFYEGFLFLFFAPTPKNCIHKYQYIHDFPTVCMILSPPYVNSFFFLVFQKIKVSQKKSIIYYR